MLLKKKQIHMSREEGRALAQIPIDDDFNVPDNRPDVRKVIIEKGEIKQEEMKLSTDHVWISGKLIFCVLYQCQEDGSFRSVRGELPFQENVSIEQLDEHEKVIPVWKLSDLSVQMIHSRKLGIRALIEVEFLGDYDDEAEIGYDIVKEENEEIEVLKKQCETAQLKEVRTDTVRFRQELNLPSGKPNIKEILWKSVQPRNMEKVRAGKSIDIKGELQIFILYQPESEDNNFEWLETSVAVSGKLEQKDNAENKENVSSIKLWLREANIDVRNDMDGEPRGIQVDAIMEAYIQNFEIISEEYIEDMYGISCNVDAQTKAQQLKRIMVKNTAKLRVTEKISINDSQQIQQVCNCEGKVDIDGIYPDKDSVDVAGSVDVRIMYLTGNSIEPIGVQKAYLPFKSKLEAPGISEEAIKNSRYRIKVIGDIEQMTTILGENSQIEVRAVIAVELMIIEVSDIITVISAQATEQNIEQLQKLPGITGYIVKKGEILWDIAKQNHTTCQKIIEQNQLKKAELAGGEKLLIVKDVG